MPSAQLTNNLKRPADDASDVDRDDGTQTQPSTTPVHKLQRIDSSSGIAAADYANPNSIKKKSAGSSSRTGQACDRCKIRKIRCDARPGGCSPCLQNNTECKTTDRITGRATTRGHTEHLENENAQLKMYMVELQQQLRDSGVEPKAPPSAPAGYLPLGQWGSWGDQGWGMQSNSNGNSILSPHHTSRHRSSSAAAQLLPDFRPGCTGDNYLGVSSENDWLTPIEGTSLALFGTKIDLAEFMPSENDPASSAMSYRTFLTHAYGRTHTFAAQLPAYEQCKVYADWYFRSIQQFIPILHKPHFMELLERVYHQENYHPTSAETVMVHMVLAVINFQFSARNHNEQARHDSMAHYHYALSFIPDLVTGHKLEDIQALTLICSQLRNQPRPGAAWMFTNMVMGLAIESGLHRSSKAWQGSAMNQDPQRLEMRKRIFWSLLAFHVHISGKLGRPMPLRLEDFDIEIPEPLSDQLPDEPVTSKWKQCSWQAAIEGWKLLKIMMQVYASIYSIKSTGQYEINVHTLEKQLDDFHAQIPPELRGGPQTKDEDRVSALYLDMSVAECQLLLHHPSLCRSASPQVMSSNLDVCLHWSAKLLSSATQLKELKSLDTTWYYGTDFLAAIFTTLFANTERRDQMDSTDLQRLKHDMDQWLDVMGEVGDLLGTGSALQQAIKALVDFSIGNISRHISAKTAAAAVASAIAQSPTTQDSTQSQNQQAYDNSNSTGGYYPNGTNGDITAAQHQGYAETPQVHQEQTQNAYPSGNQFATYPNTQSNGIPGSAAYDTAAYSGEESKPVIDAQYAAHGATQQTPQPTNFMAAFQPQVTNGYQPNPLNPLAGSMNGHQVFPHEGPAAWRHFATSMMTNVSAPDDMHSAGLMASSSSHGSSAEPPIDLTAAAAMGNLQMPTGQMGNAWPFVQYGGVGTGHGHR
ncbi:Transcriptional activator protein acu-15 [Fulvia fulva]|uniref:Transcriptional activator protein acu-15 n=1 Tax=Passalora fulva TaxID=5499 RepID=A0A9Q8LEV6_PASFU|nr:Transcriptional activator protein acu-15 [Fulvia fulva]KAK4628649.1 Transcriptional activator protein acu-15 [Fulvia fulva]UJO16205.1 Transcriptional activator protein acu-15 [Fulvia fulva]